jgi:zinc protease
VKRAIVLFAILAAAGCPAAPKTDTTTSGGLVTGQGPGGGTGDTGGASGRAADPPAVVDGDVTEAWVSGMRVLVKRVPGAESVVTQLYIQGGVRNWTATNAGIEQLAIETATTGGTQSLDRDAFTKKLADLGSSIGGGSGNDYASIGAWSLASAWDETFALLVDTFRRPAMPAAQLELARAQLASAIRHERETPDGRLGYLVQETLFAAHPYARRAIGTEASVAAVTVEQATAHLASLRETSRLLLVVVGDVEATRVVDAARAALGDLPAGSYRGEPLPALAPAAAAVHYVEEKLPTNYITAVAPGPSWRDPDYVIALVAMSTLSAREFEEVRTKRNLSYAPGASFNRFGEVTTASLYVTAVDPKATMKVMLAEAKRLRDEPVGDKELTSMKSILLTRTTQAMEGPGDQAGVLASAQILGATGASRARSAIASAPSPRRRCRRGRPRT